MSNRTRIPLVGFVSCTKTRAVAEDFLTAAGANITGEKVRVILKIHSKNGVYIDDISDYGATLGPIHHPGATIQDEVLLEEGFFKPIGQPTHIFTDAEGVKWYEVEVEELVAPIRSIK
jgi:hypothetical protein